MLIGYARISTNDQETATQVAGFEGGPGVSGFIVKRLPGTQGSP